MNNFSKEEEEEDEKNVYDTVCPKSQIFIFDYLFLK